MCRALRSQSELVAGTAIVVVRSFLASLAALDGVTRSLVVGGPGHCPAASPPGCDIRNGGHGSADARPYLLLGKYSLVEVALLSSFAGETALAPIGGRREPTPISPTLREC
ncbi:MAG: hypothetical protein JWP55_572 [Mycobacterium sp.]|nr:hypothetical protein [Mycobacterium sp.]